ncbi:PREDICTED: uncharacterized protein LOC105152590 [Acromyrmex echinatior]|uniref:uncharacterized protein LOC105152590 n=1 Tax=Acromyrmex echinatior TaxID=103372 RepID=UPI000580DC4F|nr:PREDICTED: uncharacterized protein LOC105152590 [Acromyrmex echinatior]
MAEQEVDDIPIPVRRWIRGHYTKLTSSNEAKCNHYAEITIYNNRSLANLHEHLVKRHPDILSEEEKKEDKFHWTWDNFIAKSDTEATCKKCDSTIKYHTVYDLKRHLKRIHEIVNPNSDRVEDNESNSDNDMIANEDITKKTDFIPVRLYIRKHYTKLPKNNARCNYCNVKFTIHMNRLAILHDHLVKKHPDILSEEEKREKKFDWCWDYFIAKSNREATCKICDSTIKYHTACDLKRHLKRIHEIFNPNSDRVEDNESNSDNDMIANEDITKKTDFIPVRLYIRKHYTKLPKNNARCNYCNVKFTIHMNRLAILHDHLVKKHPDILSEEEKREDKFDWCWDYFIAKSNREATCKICDSTIKYHTACDLKRHLKRIHDDTASNQKNMEHRTRILIY